MDAIISAEIPAYDTTGATGKWPPLFLNEWQAAVIAAMTSFESTSSDTGADSSVTNVSGTDRSVARKVDFLIKRGISQIQILIVANAVNTMTIPITVISRPRATTIFCHAFWSAMTSDSIKAPFHPLPTPQMAPEMRQKSL